MAGQWYCNVGGRVSGPFAVEQLRQLASQRQVAPNTPISQTPQGPWVAASQVAGLFSAPDAAAAPAAPVARPAPVAQAAPAPRHAAPAAHAPPAAAPAPARPAATPVPQPVVPTAQPATPRPAAPLAAVAAPASRPAAAPPPATPPGGRGATPPVSPAGVQSQPTSLLADRAGRKTGVKGNQAALIALGVAGLLVGAGAIIGIVAYSGDTEPEVTAEGSPATLPPDAGIGVTDAESPTGTPPLSVEQRKKIVSSVTKWKSVSVGAKLPEVVRITVAQAWVSKSASGTPRDTVMRAGRPASSSKGVATASSSSIVFVADVDADDEGGEESETEEDADAAEGTSEDDAAGPARYAFIKLSITSNKTDGSLSYVGWNDLDGTAAGTSAILADESDDIYDLVPYSKSPNASRKRSVSIAPGEEITDLLVFEAPGGTFSSLRLVLPYEAFGIRARPAVTGFEIPNEVFNGASPKQLAKRKGTQRGGDAGDGTPGVKDGFKVDPKTATPDEGSTVRFDALPDDDDGGDGGGDGDSAFPGTGSVGAGDSAPDPIPDDDVPADIRQLIDDAVQGEKQEGEAKPFDEGDGG